MRYESWHKGGFCIIYRRFPTSQFHNGTFSYLLFFYIIAFQSSHVKIKFYYYYIDNNTYLNSKGQIKLNKKLNSIDMVS
jgi:hypothetical protein